MSGRPGTGDDEVDPDVPGRDVPTSPLGEALRHRLDVLAAIAAGGALGSLARWGLGEAWPHQTGRFAWATFSINVTGCFLLGVLMVFVTRVWAPSRYVRPFLGVGVLGGYTTFSTYALDTRAMLASDRPAAAGAYLFGSLLAGLSAVLLGTVLIRSAVGTRRQGGRG